MGVWVCGGVCVCRNEHRCCTLGGEVGPHGSEVTGGCEVPNMDTENLTQVLGKRAPHF